MKKLKGFWAWLAWAFGPYRGETGDSEAIATGSEAPSSAPGGKWPYGSDTGDLVIWPEQAKTQGESARALVSGVTRIGEIDANSEGKVRVTKTVQVGNVSLTTVTEKPVAKKKAAKKKALSAKKKAAPAKGKNRP